MHWGLGSSCKKTGQVGNGTGLMGLTLTRGDTHQYNELPQKQQSAPVTVSPVEATTVGWTAVTVGVSPLSIFCRTLSPSSHSLSPSLSPPTLPFSLFLSSHSLFLSAAQSPTAPDTPHQ